MGMFPSRIRTIVVTVFVADGLASQERLGIGIANCLPGKAGLPMRFSLSVLIFIGVLVASPVTVYSAQAHSVLIPHLFNAVGKVEDSGWRIITKEEYDPRLKDFTRNSSKSRFFTVANLEARFSEAQTTFNRKESFEVECIESESGSPDSKYRAFKGTIVLETSNEANAQGEIVTTFKLKDSSGRWEDDKILFQSGARLKRLLPLETEISAWEKSYHKGSYVSIDEAGKGGNVKFHFKFQVKPRVSGWGKSPDPLSFDLYCR